MYTKSRSPLSITPRPDTQPFKSPIRHVSGKGKSVSFLDAPPPPPPPLGLLNDNGPSGGAEEEGLNDWRRFKEAGLLDEAVMEMKDREALAEKAQRLEKELFDYQYNMGLLLIENKEIMENTEELKEALAETQEVVKREQAAHYMALSEAEKRYDDLRKALEFEKRCGADLEKALREINEEHEQLKLQSQINLADANNIVAGIEDKARKVEEKMQLADAKLADVERKKLDLEKRLQELATDETMLQSERQSFIDRREAWEKTCAKQKEDLKEWEMKLQEGEERLCEGRRIINLRENKVNEIEKTIKLKEKELEDAHNKIAPSILELKKKEDDLNKRLSDLIAEEEQAGLIRKNLEIKEKELLDLTEKLDAKERVEIQKLLDSHKEALETERKKFDLEMDEKRKSSEADMRNKMESIEQKIEELNHKEEKLQRLEKSLEKKSTRLNDKEKEIDLKSKSLKENEKSSKAEAKKLELDKKQLLADIKSLEDLKATTETIKDEIAQQELKVQKEIENLRITEDERTNFSRLQSELKEEIEKCRIQKELTMKELDDLKNDRLKFEKEWEVLDEKKSDLEKEIMKFNEEKENSEKKLKFEAEKLEKEKLSVEDYVKQQMEVVKLEKETFEATKKHEESLLVERYENEHQQLLHDFEKRKTDFEADLQNRRTEMERKMRENETAFEVLREKELNNITYWKEVSKKDFEELKSERERIDKEKNEIVLNDKKLKENQVEVQKDINELAVLNKKVKDQREDFVKERNHFIQFVEKLKNCENCHEIIRNFELSDTQIPEIRDEKSEGIIANKLKSWVSSTVFKLTPHSHQLGEIPEIPLPETVTNLDAKVDDIVQKEQFGSENVSLDDNQSYMGSKNVPEASEQSEMRSVRKNPARKPKGRASKALTVETLAEEGSEKTVGLTTRKRAHAETSLVSGSEMDGESEAHSESVTAGGGGGRRKRRQTVAPLPQTPGESRYNLRRHKTEDVAPQAKAPTKSRKKKEVSVTKEPETVAAVDTATVSDGVSMPLVHTTISKRTNTLVSDTTTFKTQGDVAGTSGTMKIVENTEEIFEEVNVAHEYQSLDNNEDDNGEYNDDDNDDEYNDDDSDDDDGLEKHPGEVSIGKKIWKFLST